MGPLRRVLLYAQTHRLLSVRYSHVYVLMHVNSRGPRRVIMIRIGRPGAWCYLISPVSCIRTAGVFVTLRDHDTIT
jgi:hypothetical protein